MGPRVCLAKNSHAIADNLVGTRQRSARKKDEVLKLKPRRGSSWSEASVGAPRKAKLKVLIGNQLPDSRVAVFLRPRVSTTQKL
jgi:hypothetical protein